MKIYFDHEKLDVYQESIAFCGWVGELLGQISAKTAAKDQLDRASTSLPLNIAEGNGKFSKVDRARSWKSRAAQRWSVLQPSMCLRCKSLSLPSGSLLARKGESELLICLWEC